MSRRERKFTAEQVREVERRVAKDLSDSYELGRRAGYDAPVGSNTGRRTFGVSTSSILSPLWMSSKLLYQTGFAAGQAKLKADLDKRCGERSKK